MAAILSSAAVGPGRLRDNLHRGGTSLCSHDGNLFLVLARKTARFSDDGLTFLKSYGRRTIRWEEMENVERRREPMAHFYRITCRGGGKPKDYVVCSTQDDSAFERCVIERQIPFEATEFLNRDGLAPDSGNPS
jgi:hypothetical protein